MNNCVLMQGAKFRALVCSPWSRVQTIKTKKNARTTIKTTKKRTHDYNNKENNQTQNTHPKTGKSKEHFFFSKTRTPKRMKKQGKH